jgi:hypothetical protein
LLSDASIGSILGSFAATFAKIAPLPGTIDDGLESLSLVEIDICLAGGGRAGSRDEDKEGDRCCEPNAEEVGLAKAIVPDRATTGLDGTLKSSANNWSAVSSSIDVSADDEGRPLDLIVADVCVVDGFRV